MFFNYLLSSIRYVLRSRNITSGLLIFAYVVGHSLNPVVMSGAASGIFAVMRKSLLRRPSFLCREPLHLLAGYWVGVLLLSHRYTLVALACRFLCKDVKT